jgi:chorismate-pyruvate lyase
MSALPRETRMLLESEGSTTVLLESLIGVQVEVRVDRQEPTTAASLSDEARDSLRLSPSESVVLRRSRLVLPDAGVVSVNRVAFRPDAVPWLMQSIEDAPIGHQLRGRRSLQYRTMLANGLSDWPLGAVTEPCAYKKYVIHCADGAEMYVHERFNPEFVSVSTGGL